VATPIASTAAAGAIVHDGDGGDGVLPALEVVGVRLDGRSAEKKPAPRQHKRADGTSSAVSEGALIAEGLSSKVVERLAVRGQAVRLRLVELLAGRRGDGQ
jgi:hypothetical protein